MPTAGNILDLQDFIIPDQLGYRVAQLYQEWEIGRQHKIEDWKELRKYIYATDTTTTSNSTLPWKNTTTVPKLTQIRDNLYANYMATMFPNPRWLEWQGANQDEDTLEKEQAIKAYMSYVIDQPGFKDTVSKLVLDYIDYGNCFAIPDWTDETTDDGTTIRHGYVGPVLRRISPLDIVFNPVAESIQKAPKIIRSIVSLGEVKELLERMSTNDDEESAKKLFDYLKEIRYKVRSYTGDLTTQDEFLRVDGFTSFRQYLESDYCEILTFYGDIYYRETDTFLKNQIIQVVDRHKIIRQEVNPSYFGYTPIYHIGWRPRQDNLWAMGPLDNLVGMQYRLDHIENLKADLFDLVTYPPLKIKGYVEDFVWGPFEKIIVGDEGDVTLLTPDTNPLNANFEIKQLEQKMEEMAGAPKEAMGFRTPGEKTKYEVQRLENGAGRMFTSKISQFEEHLLEPSLNALLELGRRKMSNTVVRVLNDEFKIAKFLELSPEDIAGSGRIRPMAARHFVEQAERIQNLTTFYQSGIGADESVRMHISSIGLARLFEELLEIGQFKLVQPFVRLSEQAEAQQMAAQAEEDNLVAMQTASGMGDDYDLQDPNAESGQPQEQQGFPPQVGPGG